MYPVRISPEADEDILHVQAYYANINQALGNEVRDAIVECIERIRNHPELYAMLYGPIRPATLRRFPFVMSYVFEDNWVVVLGLVHSSMPHDFWNSRS